MEIKIILIDDHEMFRQGLKLLLETQSDMKIIGQASNGQEALVLLDQTLPDVAVVDMLMPGLKGLDIIRLFKQKNPDIRIIVLSMYDEEGYVLRAMQEGALAYVLKEASAANLIQAVRSVVAGERYLSPKLAERAFRVYINQTPPEKEPSVLTDREREIMELAVNGSTTAEIAKKLFISERTVETHRANLMRKLGLHSFSELVQYKKINGSRKIFGT